MENISAVVDTTTRAILAFPRSFTTAVYVSQGIVNTEPILIPTSIQVVDEDLKQYNLNVDILRLTPKNKNWFGIVPDVLVTKSLLERRANARLRSSYIYTLEQQFQIQNFRSRIHYDESVSSHLLSELSKCNPETNTYSYGIVEYANIQEIEPSAAYQELSVMLDSSGLIKIRNFAWFIEYVRRFNMITDKEQLDIEMKNAWQSLVRNAYI
jgi:hypothetical protein